MRSSTAKPFDDDEETPVAVPFREHAPPEAADEVEPGWLRGVWATLDASEEDDGDEITEVRPPAWNHVADDGTDDDDDPSTSTLNPWQDLRDVRPAHEDDRWTAPAEATDDEHTSPGGIWGPGLVEGQVLPVPWVAETDPGAPVRRDPTPPATVEQTCAVAVPEPPTDPGAPPRSALPPRPAPVELTSAVPVPEPPTDPGAPPRSALPPRPAPPTPVEQTSAVPVPEPPTAPGAPPRAAAPTAFEDDAEPATDRAAATLQPRPADAAVEDPATDRGAPPRSAAADSDRKRRRRWLSGWWLGLPVLLAAIGGGRAVGDAVAEARAVPEAAYELRVAGVDAHEAAPSHLTRAADDEGPEDPDTPDDPPPGAASDAPPSDVPDVVADATPVSPPARAPSTRATSAPPGRADEATRAAAVGPEPASGTDEAAPSEAASVASGPRVVPSFTKPVGSADASPTPVANARVSASRPVFAVASAADGEVGVLVINSHPWSRVTVDGEPVGQTFLRHELPVGTHRAVLTTHDGRTHAFELTVEAERRTTYCWDFDAGVPC